MAGGAEKKASVRRKAAIVKYGGAVLAANAIFFGMRFWTKAPLTRREWTGALFLAGCYALALFSLIPAAALDVTPEASVDLLGLALVIQLGSLYSAKAWYLLAVIPFYFLYSFWGPLSSLIGGWGGAPRVGEAPAGGAQSERDVEMEAKRQRRQDHKAKRMGVAK